MGICATEAKYHINCLNGLYNKYHDRKKRSSQPSEMEVIEGIALAEVIHWVEDSIEECLLANTVPVFEQKEIVRMYNNILVCQGATVEHVKNTHCTRLINNILKHVSGLCQNKSRHNVVLTIEDDVGKAIFETCRTSSETYCSTYQLDY